ncbi:MAG: trypsin-like peptidase domain-containing protein, partial [Chloroflexi bacterium]|nr:trypsin-like peptidase domain-containing protein [Chloroflexota bacterium]
MALELLQALNPGAADAAEDVRQSLVQVHNGGRGAGAGIILHMDGLILTNAHVVRRGSIKVTLPDGEIVPARILAADPAHD